MFNDALMASSVRFLLLYFPHFQMILHSHSVFTSLSLCYNDFDLQIPLLYLCSASFFFSTKAWVPFPHHVCNFNNFSQPFFVAMFHLF